MYQELINYKENHGHIFMCGEYMISVQFVCDGYSNCPELFNKDENETKGENGNINEGEKTESLSVVTADLPDESKRNGHSESVIVMTPMSPRSITTTSMSTNGKITKFPFYLHLEM